jgi:hypothetical protein
MQAIAPLLKQFSRGHAHNPPPPNLAAAEELPLCVKKGLVYIGMEY